MSKPPDGNLGLSPEQRELMAEGTLHQSDLHQAAGAKNHGWTVVFAGLGINLALGVLYTWSMYKEDIKKLGCSTLFVAPERSATGGPLLGRNFDFPTFGVLAQIMGESGTNQR